MELLVFEIQRIFVNQPYLETLYKAIFLLGYYGLFRIGELTSGAHPVKAADVHIGRNKNKMLFILYSLKTHSTGSRPQKVKISESISSGKQNARRKTFFCPFKCSREFLTLRGGYENDQEPFFVFKDRQPVTPCHVREVLKTTLRAVHLDYKLYGFHSLRSGRCSDLAWRGWTTDQLKSAGRWSSNIVYKYIRKL